MPTLTLAHQPITTHVGNPVVVGPNIGNTLTDNSDNTYVALVSTNIGDAIQVFLTAKTIASTATTILTTKVSWTQNNPPNSGALQRLGWEIRTAAWSISSAFEIPVTQNVYHTLTVDLSTVTAGTGVMSAGFDPTIFYTDLAAGLVHMRISNQTVPGQSAMYVSQFAIQSTTVDVLQPPLTLHENFETGVLDGVVSKDNTSFWLVDYEDIYPTDNLVRFTSDAYEGQFSATISPEIVIANRPIIGSEVYNLMTWIGSSPDGKIINEPVHIEWFYKYTSGPEPFFGRYIFEARFDTLGNTILTDYTHNGAPWFYPDYDYRTYMFIGLEHSNLDVNNGVVDDPDGLYYYHDAESNNPPGLTPWEIITPQPPQNTWLKMIFDWQGEGLPFQMKIVSADDESVVHMDVTHTAPQDIGLASWQFTVIGTKYPADTPNTAWMAGYDFQNWFDGVGGTTAISGNGLTSRRAFGRPS